MEQRGLVEQTDFQCIDNLMYTLKATENMLVGRTFYTEILVGPYGMMTLKTVIRGARQNTDTSNS